MNTIDTITDTELNELLDKSPDERVTNEAIQARISEVTFTRFTDTVTICNITLDNGFSVRGDSSCVSAKNYNKAIGDRIAYDKAFDALWPLFGFLLAERRYQHGRS